MPIFVPSYDFRALNDPGVNLWCAAWQASGIMDFPDNGRILEVGCCEEDWLLTARAQWPECQFIGIDTRATTAFDRQGRCTTLHADAIQRLTFTDESFDGIVSLSAIEHMGLGHYGDPVDPAGDIKVIENCLHWLKPGGWLYFDVPYNLDGYRQEGTEFRCYDDASYEARLLRGREPAWTGYVYAGATTELIPKPTVTAEPFYYRAAILKA